MATSRRGKRLALLSAVVLVVVLAGVVWLGWDEILFWVRFKSLGLNAQGFREYRHRQTEIVFVKLPGGTFLMGSPADEAGREEGELQHKVTLSPFLIAKFEVSQSEWERVMGDNSSMFKGDKLPVENVSWHDCQEFCKKTGLRLPTEAEWEYACRAGSTTAFCYGDDPNLLGEYAWYEQKPKPGKQTHPVGKKKPNAFGLFDVHGNVLEWCEDIYDADFYSKPEATKKDPLCMSGSGNRVLRGGSWLNLARDCRSAYRLRLHPVLRLSVVGFRPSRPCSP